MQNISRICMLGHGGAGKSTLVIQMVQNHFVDEYDPTLEEDYRKQVTIDEEVALLEIFDTYGSEEYSAMWEQWIRHNEFFFILQSFTCNNMDDMKTWFERIRRVKDTDDKILPVFVVASKCDLTPDRQVIRREDIIAQAAALGAAGYYETSGKCRINVEEVFFDAVRWLRRRKTSEESQAKMRKELAKYKGPAGLLPWNWGKKAEWNAKLKRLDIQNPTATRNQISGPSDDEISKFRFPEPTLAKAHVAFYKDIGSLLTTPEGKDYTDVWLHAENCTRNFYAHRIILCLRSEYFRKLLLKTSAGATVQVEGTSADDEIEEILHFFYTNTLRPGLSKDLLQRLQHCSNAINSSGLKNAVTAAIKFTGGNPRMIESSDAVQKEMQPALKDLKDLADVQIVVEKNTFKLHRAIICARCKWLQVLLAERWRAQSAQPDDKKIEITSFSADVFGTVVEFLYTGRASIAEEIAIEVIAAADLLGLPRLTQLAEIALGPLIDAVNAVPVYLAAEHYGATQLKTVCQYWMAVEYNEAKKNKQWNEVNAAVQESVRKESERLAAKRAEMRAHRVLMQQLPCVLAKTPF